MIGKFHVAAMAVVALSSLGATFALAGGPDVQPRPSMTEDGRPSIARGTDLRPCKPGTHSEFSRLTGGYRCAPNA